MPKIVGIQVLQLQNSQRRTFVSFKEVIGTFYANNFFGSKN